MLVQIVDGSDEMASVLFISPICAVYSCTQWDTGSLTTVTCVRGGIPSVFVPVETKIAVQYSCNP